MKSFLPVILMILCAGFSGYSQQPATSFETDFSGTNNGNWVSIDESADPSEFIFDYSNEEMHMTINKTSWHFVQLWVKPFNFKQSPYISFDIKTNEAVDINIVVKEGDTWNFNYDFTTSGTGSYEHILINFSANAGAMTTDMSEMQFSVPFGAWSGEIWIDNFKMGDAAKPVLQPPTIDEITNLLLETDPGIQTVQLTGISAGGDEGQTLEVTAASDNTDLIPSVSVTYSSPDSAGSITFTPAAGKTGEAAITVTVTDDGIFENETEISFKVFVMEYGGTAFIENFDSVSIDTLWDLVNPDYTLSQSDGLLNISAGKNAGWESFSRRLDGFYDFSSDPYLNVDVKGSKPFWLHAYLVDAEDNNVMKEIRIMESEKFVTASFDFSDATGINMDQITGLIFAFNGNALTFSADVWFDSLKVGSAASNKAYMAAVPDHSVYINSGSNSVLLTDISNSTGVTVSSQGTVIENAAISEITDGIAEMSFDIITDATGSDTIMLTVAGSAGYEDYTETFIIRVEENAAPEIDQAGDIQSVTGEEVEVGLTGINDGNPNDEQSLTVTAKSSNESVISNPVTVEYSEGPYASLVFTPGSTGTANITVSLVDDGGGTADSSSMTFSVEVFSSLNNPPTIDPVATQNVFNNAGEISLELTGISDGDDGSQNLVITAVSSVDTIIPNPVTVEYTAGSTALLKYIPDSSNTGASTIELKITDDGGTVDNNGNDSVLISFVVATRVPPLTGWVVPIGEGDLYDYFSAEEDNVSWFMSYVDSTDFKALELRLENKWEYGGMWMDMPVELDLTDYPYISYDVYPVGSTLTKTVEGVTEPITDTYHWNYFFDVNGERNILNSTDHMLPVPPDTWTTLSFDYSDPGDMLTGEGEEILNSRITDVLFNLHWRIGDWPFTDMSGTVYYRNIRIGDKAIIPEKTPVATVNKVPTQTVYINSDPFVVTLTGISDGAGSVDGVTVTAFSGRSTLIPDPVMGDLQPDGSMTLTFTPGEKSGTSPISVIVEAEGSEDELMSFDVDVVKDDVDKLSFVNIDRTETFQTIDGMGTFENERRWIDLYATDMGASAVRLGLISNQIEPVNDNNDPYVLDMEALNYGAFDFEYFRMLKEAGVETFILTSWSPPAWMKRNLSRDWLGPNAEWDTDAALNRLEYHHYNEFAESMVAVVKMFEQEAGITLDAIGLQNEPAFDEPYASAILDLQRFADLIEVVGKRFEEEGITTGLYMPEQVVGQFNNSNIQYLDALQNDADANPYCGIFGVHGYGSDGITPGMPSYTDWDNMYEQAQKGDYPKKVWMTETHIGYEDWNSAMSTAGAIHGSLWAGNISLWTNWSFGDMQLTKNEPNSTFYTSKNYFKYIRPGAVRLGTESGHSDILATAFEHTEDGTFTVVLVNKGNNPVSVQLTGDNLPDEFSAYRTSRYENFIPVNSVTGEMFILPGSSVTTLYTTEDPELTIDDLDNLFLEEDDPEQTVQLSGISDGSGGIASLTLETETSDEALITGLIVSAIQPDGTATLNFTPGTDQSGTAVVTVILSDGTDSKEVKFYVVVEASTDVVEVPNKVLKAYPNPVSGELFIVIPEEGLEHLIVADMTGRILIRERISSENMVSIDMGSLSEGIYIIRVSGNNKVYRTRIIVE